MTIARNPLGRFAGAVFAGVCAAAAAAGGAPLGDEFQVNTYTTSDQQTPVVARSASGAFVAVWDSFGQDGSLNGIFGQRFDAGGAPQGPEFQVNLHSGNIQTLPAVASNASGDFVVAWESNGQARTGVDVYARAFAADGTPKSGEVHVNDSGRDVYAQVGVGIDGAGDYVVVWAERKVLGTLAADLNVVEGRLFAADGMPRSQSFAVEQTTKDTLRVPAVAMNAGGGFVVAWQSVPRGRLSSGALTAPAIMARRFPAGGGTSPATLAFNVTTIDSQTEPDLPQLAIDNAGDFVVAWETLRSDLTPMGVFARRFSPTAQPLGKPFRTGAAMQRHPAVAMNGLGAFVIAGHGNGIYAQRYAADGSALGGEIHINQSTSQFTQFNAGVGLDSLDDFVVVWQNFQQDGDGRGVFARLFAGG